MKHNYFCSPKKSFSAIFNNSLTNKVTRYAHVAKTSARFVGFIQASDITEVKGVY